jgi:hypothetical protein
VAKSPGAASARVFIYSVVSLILSKASNLKSTLARLAFDDVNAFWRTASCCISDAVPSVEKQALASIYEKAQFNHDINQARRPSEHVNAGDMHLIIISYRKICRRVYIRQGLCRQHIWSASCIRYFPPGVWLAQRMGQSFCDRLR